MTNLRRANLEGADLRGANLKGVKLLKDDVEVLGSESCDSRRGQ